MSEADGILSAAYGTRAISSVASGYAQGSSYLTQSKYEANALRLNARLLDKEKQDLESQAAFDANRALYTGKRLSDEQYMEYAAMGVDPNSGSAARVRASSEYMSAVDALTIKNNAYKQAFGYQVQKDNYLTQAKFVRMAGRNLANASFIGGAASGISDALMASYFITPGKKQMPVPEAPTYTSKDETRGIG